MPNNPQRPPAKTVAGLPDTSSDLWGPLDVARYLGLSPNTVYAMLARDQVPGQIRFGRRWRISVPKLMRSIHGEDAQAS